MKSKMYFNFFPRLIPLFFLYLLLLYPSCYFYLPSIFNCPFSAFLEERKRPMPQLGGWTDGWITSTLGSFSPSLYEVHFLFKFLLQSFETRLLFPLFQFIHLPNHMRCINFSSDPYFSSNHTKEMCEVREDDPLESLFPSPAT